MKSAIMAIVCTLVVFIALSFYEAWAGRAIDFTPILIYFLILVSIRQGEWGQKK